MISARDAFKRLSQGNRRFVSGGVDRGTTTDQRYREELVAASSPFACILGCSDARVPPEMIFQQGLGDLFVIRVAGNIAESSQIGSVEFAVEQLGTRLVVVLGHADCGAVKAALGYLESPTDNLSPGLQSIVDRIRPSIEVVMKSEILKSSDEILRQALRAGIRGTVDRLIRNSPVLEKEIASGEVVVVGAEYSLCNGQVDFFDDFAGF
jgi:carbonic anhydrase